MTSDEEDIIFVSESRVANLGTQCTSKEQNVSEKEDTGEKNVVLTKTVMRKALTETFQYIKKRIKLGAPRAVTANNKRSSGSDVKTLNQSFNKRLSTCIMCGENFEKYADINVHLIQSHSYNKQSQCGACGEFFLDKKQLEIHKQGHEEQGTTSSWHPHSALLCESERHSVDVTKVNTVESVQEKPPESEVNAENVNKENKGDVENINKSAENGNDGYKSKVQSNTCADTKTKPSLPYDKLYICKICKKYVFKSYMKIHEKIHSSKRACSQPSSSKRRKTFGSLQAHHLMNKNIGHSAKAVTQDNRVLKQICQENETSSVDKNIPDENITTTLPNTSAVRHAANIETRSTLLQNKTFKGYEAVSVTHVNPEETATLTKRSEVACVATQKMLPSKQYEENKTTLLNNNISTGIVTSAQLSISETSQTVLYVISPQRENVSSLPVSSISFPTKVLASPSQNQSNSCPTVLPISFIQGKGALSVQDGALHKPTTSLVAILNGNAAHTLPGVSGASASVSLVALSSGILASASKVANGSHLSFIRLAPPNGKVATLPEANQTISSASHTTLSNGDVSSQAEAAVEASSVVPHLSSTEGEKAAGQHENIKSLNRVTRSKIYSCPICKKGLSKKYVMQHMMRMHTGERPFQCEMCPKTFFKKSSLTKHIAVKHLVETGVTNSENTVSPSVSEDLTVNTGSGVCNVLNSQRRVVQQIKQDTTNTMVSSIPTNSCVDAKADSINSIGDHEASCNGQSASGFPQSGNRASAETQTLDRKIGEDTEREEISSTCGKKSSLGEVNGLLHKANDVKSTILDADIEIIDELQVLSVNNYNKNAGGKRKLSNASHEIPKRRYNKRRVGISKLHKERYKRICQLCNIIFSDRKYYRKHMLHKHSKYVSSKANVQCHLCGKLFMYFRSLKQHLILKHPKK